MDKVILELVEIDRQAREAVTAAEERSASEREQIAREKDALAARYRKRAQQKAEIIKKRADDSAERELAALEARYRASLQGLEERFRQQEQQWVEEIVRRCRQP